MHLKFLIDVVRAPPIEIGPIYTPPAEYECHFPQSCNLVHHQYFLSFPIRYFKNNPYSLLFLYISFN